jgi:hypothetical protein
MPHGVQVPHLLIVYQFTVVLDLSCYPHKFDFSVIYSAELSSFAEMLVFLHSQLSTAMELPVSYSCLTLQTWWQWHVSYGSGL